MECTIRPALEDDADEISAVILRALRETNAQDYANKIIARVERSFSPSTVRELIGKRTVLVATTGGCVVGRRVRWKRRRLINPAWAGHV